MKELLLIGIGGGIGSIFRFLLSKALQSIAPFAFPVGTLFVNVSGSFLIGFLSLLMFNRFAIYSFEFRALILIGLLGGFTTFSTFSLEAIDLWESGERAKMIIYLLTSLVLGLCATYGGIILGRKL